MVCVASEGAGAAPYAPPPLPLEFGGVTGLYRCEDGVRSSTIFSPRPQAALLMSQELNSTRFFYLLKNSHHGLEDYS